MKKIPLMIVPLFTVLGDPITDTGKPDGNQVKIDTIRFLLERTADPQFTAGKSGYDAAVATADSRQAILDQREVAQKRGYLLLEDAMYADFLRATLTPHGGYLPQIQHNFVPLLNSIKDAVTVKPGDLDAPSGLATAPSAPVLPAPAQPS